MGLNARSVYLTIPVSNSERSIEWYKEHLGFKVTMRDPMYVELQNDFGVKILLQQNEHNLHSHFVYPNGSPQSSYGFMVDDAEIAFQYFKDQGIKIGEFFDYQGKSFSFYDLDGNFIEIWSK